MTARSLFAILLISLFTLSCTDKDTSEEVRPLTSHTLYNASSCTVFWDFDHECTMDLGTFEYEHNTKATCDGTKIEVTYTCEDAIDNWCGTMEHQLVTRTYGLVRRFTEADLDPTCDPVDPELIEAVRCLLDRSPNFYLLKEISYDICDANDYECTHGICLSVGGHIIAPHYVAGESIADKESCLETGREKKWLSCFDDLLIRGNYYLSAWGYGP